MSSSVELHVGSDRYLRTLAVYSKEHPRITSCRITGGHRFLGNNQFTGCVSASALRVGHEEP